MSSKIYLNYDSVKKINPEIIDCSISAWGHQVGASAHHFPVPVAIVDTTAALHACTAIASALYHRQVFGQGQNTDIALVDCLFTLQDTAIPACRISEAAWESRSLCPAATAKTQRPHLIPLVRESMARPQRRKENRIPQEFPAAG